MKKRLLIILGVLIVASTFGPVRASDMKTVAVLPFDVHSSENIDYIRNGVWDMLISRISLSGKIEVTAKHTVSEALGKRKGDLAAEDVYDLGKKMKVDYVVYGSITKIGNSVSLDGKLLDVATHKSPVDVFSQSQGMDDVIPKIGDFAKRIDYHILGQVPSTFGAPPAPSGPPVYGMAPQQPAGPSSSKDPEAIDAVRTRQGTFTAVINPEFINAPQSIDRKGFWMSQRFDTEFKGMDIGDVNGDGINEVVVVDVQNIMIYKKEGKTLKLLQKIPGESYDQYLSVDVADVTGSGKKEIIVTSYNQGLLDSFVLQHKDGKYVKIAKDLRWFLRVIEVSGTPTLVGQKMGIQMPFGAPIHEIVWENGKFREGKRINIPEGLSVYGLLIEPLDKDGPNRVIAFDSYDYLRVYEESTKLVEAPNTNVTLLQSLWKSDDVFGGSNNYFDLTLSQQQSTRVQYKPYINMRLLAYDINKKGKKELIVVKNHSTVGRVFQNLRAFTSSEIYDLEWNGMGFVENWKTKKIQGYVADYQIRDIDNDGNPDVVLLVITSLDMGFSPKSMVVSYSLTMK
jgi:TolB-like protein